VQERSYPLDKMAAKDPAVPHGCSNVSHVYSIVNKMKCGNVVVVTTPAIIAVMIASAVATARRLHCHTSSKSTTSVTLA
jgi:hypothetical protein